MPSRRGLRWEIGCGVLLVATSLAPAEPRGPLTPAEPTVARADADAVREAVQVKIKAATEILAMCREFLLAPPGAGGNSVEIAEQIQYWSRELTDARLEGTDNHDERVAILTEAATRAREFEAQIKDLLGVDAKGMDKIAIAKAAFYRADLDVRLLRAKAEPQGQSGKN